MRPSRSTILQLAAVLAVVAASLAAAAGTTSAGAQSDPYRVLILGDSFSAGTGSPDGTFYSTAGCYRSTATWGEKLAQQLRMSATRTVEVVNRACSGAVTRDLWESQVTRRWGIEVPNSATDAVALDRCRRSAPAQATADGGTVEAAPRSSWSPNATADGITRVECVVRVPPQRDWIDDSFDLVVITIGGNDLDFAGIALHCLTYEVPQIGPITNHCRDAMTKAFWKLSAPPQNEGLKYQMENLVTEVLNRLNPASRTGDKGQVLLASYPYLVRNLDDSNNLSRFKMLQDQGDLLATRTINALDQSHTTAGGCEYHTATFANTTKAEFGDHSPIAPLAAGVERDRWWLNWIRYPRDHIFHPTARGYEAMGAAAFTGASAGGVPARINCTGSTTTTTSTIPPSNPTTRLLSAGKTPDISRDGRFVAYVQYGIQVLDVAAGTTARADISTAGQVAAGGGSGSPALSSDGRYVAFWSGASNLVPGDTNGALDVFVHDRVTGSTRRVSVSSDGVEANSGPTISVFGDYPAPPSISDDGRFVAFGSPATNLVPQAGAAGGVFVHDTLTGITELASVNSQGAPGEGGGSGAPDLSADGRFVAYVSNATNLVSGDTNSLADVFVFDRQTRSTERASVSSAGGQVTSSVWMSGPAISADGRYVAFKASFAKGLVVDAWDGKGGTMTYVRDRSSGATSRVSVRDDGGTISDGNNTGYAPSISADGCDVAFDSTAPLSPAENNSGKLDVFVRDRCATRTRQVSVNNTRVGADDAAERPSISGDGRFIVYGSWATNLASEPTGGTYFLYLYDRDAGN